MIPQAERKKTHLTEDLWKDHPAFAKSLFAIRLISILFPAAISKRLQKLIGDEGVFNPDLQPPGWIYDPNEFPPPVDYTSYGDYGSLPTWLTDMLTEDEFNALRDSGQLTTFLINNFGSDEISYFNGYGSLPSWVVDIWGAGPVHHGGALPPPGGTYWFVEPWSILDETVWTKTVYGIGSLSTSGGRLQMRCTDIGLGFSLYHDVAEPVPSAVDIYIRVRAVSGSGYWRTNFYTGQIVLGLAWTCRQGASGLDFNSGSAIFLWAQNGQKDTWKFELRATGWKAYLNESKIAESADYTPSTSNPGRISIEGRNVFTAFYDYLIVEDVS